MLTRCLVQALASVSLASVSLASVSLASVSLASVSLAALTAAGTLPAAAGPALLIEANTGQVLYAEDVDHTWYPASLTKLMTAYVVFEALKSGQVTLETKVPLSEKARAQPATRIGLRAGIELNVEQALRGLILRSANDFAMALAELVGESEEGFADRMNAAAKRLGMSRSHFKNPHGLPDPEHITTARDMAIVTLALHHDFPDRADIFSTPQVVIYKGTFHSQNELLRTIVGADGMKTGFTCGAGYNIVASATRDGHRLIAVVMGELTRVVRSERATALLEHGFRTVDWKQTLGVPKLSALPVGMTEPDPVHDMSGQTRASQCPGGRGQVRRAVARVKPAGAPAAPTAAAASRGPAGGPAGGGG